MQLQSLITQPELEPSMAKSEVVVRYVGGQELDPETIECNICRMHALSLSKADISPNLSVSVKDGKYILFQKLQAIQQSNDPNAAAKQCEQTDNISNPTDDSDNQGINSNPDSNLPGNTTKQDAPKKKKTKTILTLPTEIRLMIYGYVFTSLTESSLSRQNTYPLPPLLRANSTLRNESLQEWGSHLERMLEQHKQVQQRNQAERKDLVQRKWDMARLRTGNRIKIEACIAANEGRNLAIVKRIDKLRLLQAPQMLAVSGGSLAAGGSGNRWRDGRV